MQDTTLTPERRATVVEPQLSLTEEAVSPNTQRMRRSAAKAWHEFRTGRRLYGWFKPEQWREFLDAMMSDPPTPVTLRKFVAWLHRQGRAYETVQAYTSHVNMLCKMVLDESPRSNERVKQELKASRKLRPPIKHHSKAITAEILPSLLKSASPIARAAFMTQYTFALRISELLAIKGSDVAFDGQIMTLTIPVSKTRRTPEEVSARLYTGREIGVDFSHRRTMQYLKDTFGEGRLFPMSVVAYRKMLRDAVTAAGLDPAKYRPHGFRRGRESDLLMHHAPHEVKEFRTISIQTMMKHYHEARRRELQVRMSESIRFGGARQV